MEIGSIYNKLTIIGLGEKSMFLVRCECGVEKYIRKDHLTDGKVISCGCHRKKALSNATISHGYSRHPLYAVWVTMKMRCYNVNNHKYQRYGGRGVTVCDEWINSPEVFISWALDNGWTRGLQIDKDIKANILGEDGLVYSPEWCSVVTNKDNCQYKTAGKRKVKI